MTQVAATTIPFPSQLFPARPLVVIPTYNERDNIADIVTRVLRAVPRARVLIVDDDSPDGTGAVADQLSRGHAGVQVLHRSDKNGLGAAYLHGFAWALDGDVDAVIEMDADGSHAPEQLPLLLAALAHADVVLGSRWVAGGSVTDWPRRRELLSRAGNRYARFALGVKLRDVTGGFRAFRREALEAIDLTSVTSQGYCFQVELAWRCVEAGFVVTEVPISFQERQLGESKMDRRIIVEALRRLSVWGLERRVRRVAQFVRGVG